MAGKGKEAEEEEDSRTATGSLTTLFSFCFLSLISLSGRRREQRPGPSVPWWPQETRTISYESVVHPLASNDTSRHQRNTYCCSILCYLHVSFDGDDGDDDDDDDDADDGDALVCV